MSRRNLLFILLAGLVLALGAAGAAQRDSSREDGATESPATVAKPSSGGVEANLVQARMPADGTVRVTVGDEVELRVASDTPDVAELMAFAVRAPVGPGLPGAMRFQALSEGRFPVMLEVAGTSVGDVVVDAAEPAP